MPRAVFNGKVIAESEEYEFLEGNVYFPPDSLKREFFSEAEHSTVCWRKGRASYYTVSVDGREAAAAAWYYPEPNDAAGRIKGHVAFYPVVTVER